MIICSPMPKSTARQRRRDDTLIWACGDSLHGGCEQDGEKICIESMADDTPFDLQKTYRCAINSYAEMAVATC